MVNLGEKILNAIQRDFPLASRPFAAVGQRLGLSEEEVLAELRRLRQTGALRAIAVVFEPRRLGYVGGLCAMKAPRERLDEIAALVNRYPEVTHNYSRDHAYCLWFALVARSRERIEEIVRELRQRTGIADIFPVYTRRRFKISATFRLGEEEPVEDVQPAQEQAAAKAPPIVPALVRELARGLELVEEPYGELSQRVGMPPQEIIRHIRGYLQSGVARRFGALVRPTAAGVAASAMIVWRVPGGPDEVERAGRAFARFAQVSHCYERDTLPDFPYNLYTMVHANTREQCLAVAREMAQRAGVEDFRALFTVREYKKTSPAYFAEEGQG